MSLKALGLPQQTYFAVLIRAFPGVGFGGEWWDSIGYLKGSRVSQQGCILSLDIIQLNGININYNYFVMAITTGHNN